MAILNTRFSTFASLVTVLLSLASCQREPEPPPPANGFEFTKKFFDGEDDAVVYSIDEANLPSVLIARTGDSVMLEVFQQGTGVPVATLKDDNGDGVFDWIIYSALSEDGYILATAEDYGMDGTQDFVLYVEDAKPAAKVHYNGQWIKVAGMDDGAYRAPTVEIDGETRSLAEVLDELGQP